MKIFCFLFGHKWTEYWIYNEHFKIQYIVGKVCEKCGEIEND